MKTSKKILFIILSILLVGLISTGLAFGIELFFAFSFWKSFVFVSVLQLLVPILWDRYYVSKQLIAIANDYNSKPFRKYIIPLNCSHCGFKNDIDIDLNETEFKCTNCKKDNGIHLAFQTAAITEPMGDNNII
jgi:hypothetical protein